jgi:hypothetical protein
VSGGLLPAGLEARRAALLATLQGGADAAGGAALPAGRYVVEVDALGAVKHIQLLSGKGQPSHNGGGISPLAIPAVEGERDIRMVSPAPAAPAAAAAAAGTPSDGGAATSTAAAAAVPAPAASAAGGGSHSAAPAQSTGGGA